MSEKILSLRKMFQSNIYYLMSMKVYIVSIEEIYGVLSLSMEFYLCLWNSIFVYGVLSLYMEFYLCIWSSIFVYVVLSLSTEFYLCIWSSIFVYGVLSLSTEFYLCMRLLGACIWKRLGACMRLLGASRITAESLPDSR